MNERPLEIGMKIFEVKFPRHFFSKSFQLSYLEKYDIVGRLLKPGEKPSVYPSEESTVDASENSSSKKNE